MTPRKLSMIVVLGLAGWSACRAPLGDLQYILERHQQAVAKLPEEDRQTAMPYGAPLIGDQAEQVLPDHLLTLEQARTLALRANPDIHAAQARLLVAAARIAEARARYLPNVVFSHNSSRTFHTPASRNTLDTLFPPTLASPLGVDPTNLTLSTLLNALRQPLLGDLDLSGDSRAFSAHSTTFSSTWTVFDGFVREAQILARKHEYRATTMALVDVERLLVQAVDAAYHRIQLAEEQLRIARADEGFSEEQLEETGKLQAAGRATQADVDNFRVRVLAARANVTAALGVRDVGRVVLAELMGIPGTSLPDDLSLSELVDETAGEMTPVEAGEWVARAMVDRPDLGQLEQIVRAEEETVRASRGLYYPNIAISGSWGFDRTSNLRYSQQDQSTAAAVEFRWELFTGGARTARVRAAEARRVEATSFLNRRRLAAASEVRQAVIRIRDAQEQIQLQRESLDTARENRRVVQAAYVAGKETLTRLNEAQRDYTAAEVQLARARVNLRDAWSELRTAAAAWRPSHELPSTDPDRP